ncbi:MULTISPECIES: host cell division inhibitor Icd-like protein [Serratia]|uniref:host cell division inhibitor Icd-like protein n=1 Tax=Serratia TaxID=613 RepID=UPI00157C7D67|nr:MULTISPECIES: host cell division inhibitor Icd-like protein [Serratia]MBP1130282.1 hypothetical protein [Serratia sp. PL17]
MAKFHCTHTQPKYQYRFLAIARLDLAAVPCRLSVEAASESEARQILAQQFILSLAARLPSKETTHG